MQCQDTGCTEAIHIPKPVIELAQELMPVIDFVQQHSSEGQITLKVGSRGKVPFFDIAFRMFRGKQQKAS